MNVGELRRALEGVSDTREVCVVGRMCDAVLMRTATGARTRAVVPTVAEGAYCHPSASAVVRSATDRLVFVIE